MVDRLVRTASCRVLTVSARGCPLALTRHALMIAILAVIG
jgi:hypothetical protein